MLPGGKGANQAVAAAKLGAEVVFVAKLGKDVFASKSLPLLAAREAVPLRPPNHAPFGSGLSSPVSFRSTRAATRMVGQ